MRHPQKVSTFENVVCARVKQLFRRGQLNKRVFARKLEVEIGSNIPMPNLNIHTIIIGKNFRPI